MSLGSLCRWLVQVSVYCAGRIPAHLTCTECSILLHLIDIDFLPYISLWQISQIQTLFVCGFRPWICLNIRHFYEQQRQLSSGSAWLACPKETVNRAPILGGGRLVCNRCASSTVCRMCRLEPLLLSLASPIECKVEKSKDDPKALFRLTRNMMLLAFTF